MTSHFILHKILLGSVVKRKCENVESVTEGADRKKRGEGSAKIVKIEINNCSGCVFNWSRLIRDMRLVTLVRSRI